MLTTIRSWITIGKIKQEPVVSAGVILFLVGLIVSATIIKVLAFVLSGSAIAYRIVVGKQKNNREESQSEDESSPITLQEQVPEMKKLVFDDLQPTSKQYKVVEIVETESNKPQPLKHLESEPVVTAADYEFHLSDFFDLNEELFVREGGPKSEFGYLMKKVLAVIKEVNFAHTVAFFWVNRDKNQIVLESFVSDSDKFITHRRRELGNDLISQVALSGQPKLLNHVNMSGQLEMLGYYEGVEPVKTFIAAPIFYSKTQANPQDPVAVLTIDCIGDDAYGPETLSSLGQFAKLISALIKSYTDKYDLLLDSEVLRSIARIREQMRIDSTLHNLVRTLSEETSKLIAWDYISVVLFDEGRKSWVVQFVMNRMNDSYVAATQEIDPHHSLLGSVLQSGAPKIIDNLESVELPRYYKAERVDSKGGMMMLPFISVSRCYGALVVESKDKKTYSEADIKLLQKLVEISAWALEIFSLNDVVNNYVLMDETTGVSTRKYFMERVQEEVQRANDFGTELSVVMISVDSINEHMNRYGKEGFDFVLQNVGHMIKSCIRPYDLVGRFDFNRFGVLLVSTTANEANLWAEKLRKNIASNVINIEQKSFSVTVSVGVCGSVSNTSDIELIENASQVLKKAVEAGGNIVRVF